MNRQPQQLNRNGPLWQAFIAAGRAQFKSDKTLKSYWHWTTRFAHFHDCRPVAEMGNAEICAFLTDLASTRVTFNTQAQAMHSLLWLYKSVLKQDPGWLEGFERARKPEHVPVILSIDEVDRLLAHVTERVPSLVLRIQYGTGARLSEAISLRVKDVDFSLNEITVKDGKGGKDRHLPLPDALRDELTEQVRRVRLLHQRDLNDIGGAAAMPNRLAIKYAARSKELGWQYIFPSRELFIDRETHRAVRGHVSDRRIQRAFNEARRRAQIFKHVGTHSLRHAFATHTLQAGYDIRTVQELLGHRDVKTTMIYTHVLNRGPLGVRSPLDRKACVIARDGVASRLQNHNSNSEARGRKVA